MRITKISSILLIVIIGMFLIFPTLSYAQVEQNDVIEKIAIKEHIPGEQLEILNSLDMELATGEKLTSVKIADKKSGNIYEITTDANGNEVDRDKFEKQETVSYLKKYGKKTLELYTELNNKRDSDTTMVGIWLSEDNKLPPSNIEIEKNQKSYIESIEAPVISEVIKKGKMVYASEYAPLIYAELAKKDIVELEKRDDIEIIDKEGIAKSEINSAVPTIRANLVWPYVRGSGVKVAVVEDDGIAFANPYLTDGIYYKPYEPYIDNVHATMVAGVIASTHGTYKGVAPGVSLLSANSYDYHESSLIKASDWALSKGANVLSLSWGMERDGRLHVMDKYYDYITARPPYPIVTKSAGNTGGRITTPGNAWNVITVGAIDDKNTVSWSDDIMAYYSSYIDPISTHGDREKPEVVAVGSRIKSTYVISPWVPSPEYDGTSFAGPAVAGEAALLMSKNPTLKLWPETTRAIIFASAIHNIEGSSRLSEKDGMGAVVASEAYNVVARNQLKYATITPSGIYPIRYTFNASAGKKVRAVISWNSKSTGAYGTDILKVDLDLRVKRPTTGTYVGSSLSRDNNYEIVEFIAPTTGIYTAEISKVRWDSGYASERLGFAYSIT